MQNYPAWNELISVCLFDLFFKSQSTLLQLCQNGPSWVEPVLSNGKRGVLLKVTARDADEARTRGPSVWSQALYRWATALPFT